MSGYLLYSDHDHFVRWLDRIVVEKVGRRKSDRAICREAGIAETALTKITAGGQLPSDKVAAAMARYLDVTPEEFRRRAGLDAVLTSAEESISELTQEELDDCENALRSILMRIQAIRDNRAANPE